MDHGKMEQGGAKRSDGGDGDTGKAATADELAFRVTSPQLVAVAVLSVVALAGALLFSASYANLGLGARDVSGAVMPPGMIMTRDMPGEAMRDMAAVDPGDVTFEAAADARGDQPLEPRLDDGVKVFDLSAEVITWNILSYERMFAYAINGQVPGPRIRLTEGDQVRINLTNRLPESTTLHWHGLVVPNQFDGPAEITQEPIGPARRSPTSSASVRPAPSSITATTTPTASRRWACTAR